MERRKVLIIAAHVPPYRVGSGYLRTLKFSQYLPEHQWDPVILAPSNKAFASQELSQETDGLVKCPIYRTAAIDTARHLAVRGRYLGLLAVPDRWVSWWFSAFWKGSRLIRQYRPAVIFSTYPISTAHLIGLALARWSGIPWVADFRDPMIDHDYPPPGLARKSRRIIERWAISCCAAALFTTPGTRDYYRERFPALDPEKMHLIMNGYDEADFDGITSVARSSVSTDRPLVVLHSGVLYPDIRDPTALFTALSRMKSDGLISARTLCLRLRAAGSSQRYVQQIEHLNISDIVELAPSIPYAKALKEMSRVDGLLLMQGYDANKQVPAKVFEYLRAGPPILALVDPAGDSAQLLSRAGVGQLADPTEPEEISRLMTVFVTDASAREQWRTPITTATKYSRQESTRLLATVLNSVAEVASLPR